jgi:LacI family transcriptional regulator
MAAAKDAGYSVPGDFSVTGFGDLGMFTWPPLSTVRIPIETMGARAIEWIERRRVEPTAPVVEAVVTTEFMQRGSCAPVGRAGKG